MTNMKRSEMKDVLIEKLKAENCYFKRGDVRISKTNEGVLITIDGYELLPFKIEEKNDEYFGWTLWLHEADEIIGYVSGNDDHAYWNALLQIGYRIGTTF